MERQGPNVSDQKELTPEEIEQAAQALVNELAQEWQAIQPKEAPKKASGSSHDRRKARRAAERAAKETK